MTLISTRRHYNSQASEDSRAHATESRRWINLECLRRGLLSVVVHQAMKRQYECKDLLLVSSAPSYSPSYFPSILVSLPRFKGSSSHTTPVSPSSRKTRRREVCAQLRGCNPRHDETSIVITELSGKPPLHTVPLEKHSRRMQTAYLPPNVTTTMTSTARHVPERVNSYVSPLNYETPFLYIRVPQINYYVITVSVRNLVNESSLIGQSLLIPESMITVTYLWNLLLLGAHINLLYKINTNNFLCLYKSDTSRILIQYCEWK